MSRRRTTQKELREAGQRSRERSAKRFEFREVVLRIYDDAAATTNSDIRFIIKEALRGLGHIEIVSVTKDSWC